MRIRLLQTLLLLQCLSTTIVSTPVLVQQGGQPKPEQTITLSTHLVNVDVLVTDKRTGARVDGLTRDDFEILENGHPRAITHFSQGFSADRPVALVLMIDLRPTNKQIWPKLRAALAPVISKLPREDKIAVITFICKHKVAQELTNNRDLVLQAFDRIADEQSHEPFFKDCGSLKEVNTTGKDTAKAIQAGIQHVRERDKRSHISFVAFTDDMNGDLSRGTISETTRQLVRTESTVDSLLKPNRTATQNAAVLKASGISRIFPIQTISHYASETGGEIVKINDEDYGKALEQVIGNVMARYSLGFELAESDLDGKLHKLTVRIKDSPKIANARQLEIHARQGYYATKESGN